MLDIYGKNQENQKENISKKIIESFKSCYNDTGRAPNS